MLKEENKSLEEIIQELLPKFHQKHYSNITSILTYLDAESLKIIEKSDNGNRLCEDLVKACQYFWRNKDLQGFKSMAELTEKYRRALIFGF